ncbi:hypothetical protein L3X40_16000 [Rhizorhapis sp. SPR117]|nr:hypothetical protein [Rhizorhapis sp. SPR117]
MVLFASASVLVVGHAHAQEVPSVNEPVQSEVRGPSQQNPAVPPPTADADDNVIVVTAAKRTQQISDVPLSITAASDVQLEQAGVTGVEELASVVPGFNSGKTFGGFPIFSLRGINFNSAQLSASPAVSV